MEVKPLNPVLYERLKQIFSIILIYMAIKMIGFDPIAILLGL